MNKNWDWVTRKLNSRSMKQVGYITIFNSGDIIKYNIDAPYMVRKGRLIVGTTPDGSPAVVGFLVQNLGWVGYVHDMYYGVCAARKGMLTKEMCLNALPLDDLLKSFKK